MPSPASNKQTKVRTNADRLFENDKKSTPSRGQFISIGKISLQTILNLRLNAEMRIYEAHGGRRYAFSHVRLN